MLHNLASNALRCSSLPRVMKCPASAVDPEIVIVSDSPQARLGTLVHSLITRWIQHGEVADIDAEADELGLDGDEAQYLFFSARRCWDQLAGWFPMPTLEQELRLHADGLTLTGHADLVSVVGPQVRVLDWKTGRVDADHIDQLRGYALLALRAHPLCDAAYAVVVRVREQDIEGHTWSRDQLELWWQELVDQAHRVNIYNPGRHCGFCPRGHECEARTAMVRQAAAGVLDTVVLPSDPPARATVLAQLLDRVKLIDQAAELARDLVRAEVQLAGGQMETLDGRALEIVTQERHGITYDAESRRVLRGFLSDAEIDSCLSLSKTKVEAAVSDAAPRGQKKQHIAELKQDLAAAGCLTTTSVERLEIRRVPQSIGVE